MDIKDRLDQLQSNIKNLEARRERLLGKREQLQSQLKEMGFDTVDEAVKHVEFLREEVAALEERLEKSAIEIEEALDAID